MNYWIVDLKRKSINECVWHLAIMKVRHSMILFLACSIPPRQLETSWTLILLRLGPVPGYSAGPNLLGGRSKEGGWGRRKLDSIQPSGNSDHNWDITILSHLPLWSCGLHCVWARNWGTFCLPTKPMGHSSLGTLPRNRRQTPPLPFLAKTLVSAEVFPSP